MRALPRATGKATASTAGAERGRPTHPLRALRCTGVPASATPQPNCHAHDPARAAGPKMVRPVGIVLNGKRLNFTAHPTRPRRARSG